MIEHHDLIKRGYLLENIEYMTKIIQFIKLKSSPKTRNFGRGAIPEIPEIVLGRPRTRLAIDNQTPKASPMPLNGSTSILNPEPDTGTPQINKMS